MGNPKIDAIQENVKVTEKNPWTPWAYRSLPV